MTPDRLEYARTAHDKIMNGWIASGEAAALLDELVEEIAHLNAVLDDMANNTRNLQKRLSETHDRIDHRERALSVALDEIKRLKAARHADL